mmetsp:Transcript_26022/g.32770  ORF Transcript_26022/g.32770 Transcript_26022/m.32770 type:complete len:188 (-) Transcript_26022:844-1407(-)
MNFVKTEILSSSDGISHSESKRVESVDVISRGRTLFEQLKEQKEKQQKEYETNTKLIFAPPKGLEQDDVAFIEAEAKKQKSLTLVAEKETEREIAKAFESTTRDHFPVIVRSHPVKVKKSQFEATKIKRRKIAEETKQKKEPRQEREDIIKPNISSNTSPSKNTTTLTALIGCYDESDDDNDKKERR